MKIKNIQVYFGRKSKGPALVYLGYFIYIYLFI